MELLIDLRCRSWCVLLLFSRINRWQSIACGSRHNSDNDFTCNYGFIFFFLSLSLSLASRSVAKNNICAIYSGHPKKTMFLRRFPSKLAANYWLVRSREIFVIRGHTDFFLFPRSLSLSLFSIYLVFHYWVSTYAERIDSHNPCFVRFFFPLSLSLVSNVLVRWHFQAENNSPQSHFSSCPSPSSSSSSSATAAFVNVVFICRFCDIARRWHRSK